MDKIKLIVALWSANCLSLTSPESMCRFKVAGVSESVQKTRFVLMVTQF